VIDEREKDVLRRLFERRDPSPELLFKVEALNGDGVSVLCDLLASGTLNEREQLRALQGLSHAATHSGYLEQYKLVDAALPRVTAPDLALRSTAAHMVVSTIEILEAVRWGQEHQLELASLRKRVAPFLREGLALGVVEPTQRLVERFLASTAAD
jgi:hypothetical protein